MRARLLIVLLFVSSRLFAQSDYVRLDSLSYAYFTDSRWQELAVLGDSTMEFQPRFYYLEVRLGVAHYHLGHWQKAEKHLCSALELNPGSRFAAGYLFWIYHLTHRKKEAFKMAMLQDDTVRASLPFRAKSGVRSLYMESGLRVSNKIDSAGNVPYAYAGFNAEIGHIVDAGFYLSALEQRLFWSKFNQQSAGVSASIDLGSGWNVGLQLCGITFNRMTDVSYGYSTLLGTEFIPSPGGPPVRKDSLIDIRFSISGRTRVNAMNSHFHLNKYWCGFNIGFQTAFYLESVKPSYDSIVSYTDRTLFTYPDNNQNEMYKTDQFFYSVKKVATNNQIQLGGSLDYTLRRNEREWIRPGFEVQFVFRTQRVEPVYVPYLELILHRSFSLFGYYMQKGSYPVSILDGQAVFNNIDRMGHRLSLTAGITLSRNAGITFTYQHDRITDAFTGLNYNLNSGYAGLQIKF